MLDIRNDGKLMCRIDEAAGIVEIQIKDHLTTLQFTPEGKIKITHARRKTLTT